MLQATLDRSTAVDMEEGHGEWLLFHVAARNPSVTFRPCVFIPGWTDKILLIGALSGASEQPDPA